ncbi:MAG: Ldh family oxidoreductase [Verrucomicrobiota bacterium]
MNKESFSIIPQERHDALVKAAYEHRGYTAEEASQAARFSAYAARHGIRTHNAIKALHLDHLFGSGSGGCIPGAKIDKFRGNSARFEASQVWDANKKLGQATAYEAMDCCIQLADQFGIGQVSVDNAFHYLWGGGYVMEAAQKGYIAYTNCTAALAEVVPFMGKHPTLGTNPHSWGFPTTDAIGFPIVIDWATSVIAMGRVQQFLREGKDLPPGAAVDKEGQPTTDANAVAALTTFGAHKGYGLSLINELMAAFIGGSLPTLRSREIPSGEKRTPAFYFQVIHPDALSGSAFAKGRSQSENVKAVIDDILGHGNEKCLLPGQIEATWATRVDHAGGLLFSEAEINAFSEIAQECGQPQWSPQEFKQAED